MVAHLQTKRKKEKKKERDGSKSIEELINVSDEMERDRALFGMPMLLIACREP